MVVDIENKLVILGNRKCASSTLYNKFLGFSKVVNPLIGTPKNYTHLAYLDNKWVLSDWEKAYFNQHFKHLNLEQGKYLLRKIGLDIEGFSYVVAIRNPYSRCISEYKYYLKNSKTSEELIERKKRGIDSFILGMQRLHENSLEYFSGLTLSELGANNIYVIKVETLDLELKNIFSKLCLPKYLDILDRGELPRVNDTKDIDFDKGQELNTITKQYIQKLFRLDFIVGGYNF